MVKSKKVNLAALILAMFFWLSNTLLAIEGSEWSMEVRVAAHPAQDANLVSKAKSSLKSELYEDDLLCAKWVPVLQNKAVQFVENEQLVTRKNSKGQVELLVLVNSNDVTEEDVRRVRPGRDVNGRLALDVQLDSAGATKLWRLTQNNLSTTSHSRHGAQIIDGQVYAALKILYPVRDYFQIPADFTDIMIDEIAKKAGGKFKKEYTPSPYAITITPLRIIIFLLILGVLIFGSLPARGLKESKHSRSWIVVGVVLGIALGGYWFGVTKSTTGPDNQYGMPPWGEITQISILGVLSGSLIGGVLGAGGGYFLRFIARRAIHNVLALIAKGSSSEL